MTSARLLRYASFLSGFDYKIQFKKGEENQNADNLSRAPVIQLYNSGDMCLNNEVHQICTQTIFEISTEKLIAETIITETEKDTALREIKKKLQTESNDTGYTLDEGIIFKGNRVVIPASLRSQVLEELHVTHI